MADDELSERATTKRVSFSIAPWDLIEASYIGGDPTLPRKRTTWRVIGVIDGVPFLALHPPLLDRQAKRQAVALIELANAAKIGSLSEAGCPSPS